MPAGPSFGTGRDLDRPPEAVKDRREMFRLTARLEVVDTNCGEEDQNQGDVEEEHEFLAHDDGSAVQPTNGGTVARQFQDPNQPQ